MGGKIDLTKLGEGRNVFGEYLIQELYRELDGFVSNFSGKISEERYRELDKENDGYKSAFKKGLDGMEEPVGAIEKLFEKAKSGEVKEENEVKAWRNEINKQYEIILQLTAAMYQLLDPQIDAYKGIIKSVYTMDAKDADGKTVIKGLDKNLFLKGCEIIKKYFLEEEMIEHIKSQAQAHQEALPQAA